MRRAIALAATVLTTALGSLVLANPVAAAQAAPSAVGDFGACMASQREGDVLLMIDESGSLQASDPDAARVSAANYLLDQLNSFGDSAGFKLDVALAGFSDDFVVHSGWQSLDDASLPGLQKSVDEFRSRTNGIDTDYRTALDGARGTLAERGPSADGGNRCQALAWFSDGKLDYTTRDGEKSYAPGISLATDDGVRRVADAARESICRPAGVSDQLRSSGIVTFGVGLAAGTAQAADFDLMRAIATGEPGSVGACGNIVSPRPGDFYVAQNIDDLLFAFDAFSTPGQAPLERETGVCAFTMCEDAQHRFVLDDSIGSVTVLGFADAEGLVPTLVSPRGEQLALPRTGAGSPATVRVGGVAVEYEWLSPRSVSFTMRHDDAAQWQGKWALAFVDPTGSAPTARSKSNIHISGNLFPAWLGQDTAAVHSGEKTSAVQLGIVDADRREVTPSTLLGTAALSVSLTDSAHVNHELATKIPKDRLGEPLELDLTQVAPGEATMRLTLEVTTADAKSESGAVIAPGTVLTPQSVDVPLTVAPPIGYPTLPSRIDFGTVEGAGTFAADVRVGGPGCVWLESAVPARIDAAPDGVGTVALTGRGAGSADDCLQVEDGAEASLPVQLQVDNAGNGAVNGAVRLMVAPAGEPDRAMPVEVPFSADLQKPLDSGRFWLTFLLVLLVSIAMPLVGLWLAKWRTSRIPAETLKAQRFPVTVVGDAVLRDGRPFAFRDEDLTQMVRGLDKPARHLTVDGVELNVRTGLHPFGAGYVAAHADGRVTASRAAKVDGNGDARLPLAVHNSWVVLHDPAGPADLADVLVLVGGNSTPESRTRLVEDLNGRLPGLLRTLREQAKPGSGNGGGTPPSSAASPGPGGPVAYDPFGMPPGPGSSAGMPSTGSAPSAQGFGGTSVADPFDPFGPPSR
ncbi:vWA domain-containing protein [Rhodococcus tukisamuensis]|uniref:VWFA domain-containing protein n=1 Tax=Rhodococcus tukisamuensis TaxID=168276 RepID=A0A1G7B5G5_9NOCA|nr:vWA domain-containing protein [Rhodococcus tukisamuensis]SDE22253.1 hypothetical protein SAMN05444580_11283 [Rhodococcus tukisamuensis]